MVHTVPAGWDLTNIICDIGSPANARGARGLGNSRLLLKGAIDLRPGEVVSCTYHFDKQGHILVEVATLPTEDPQEFTLKFSFDEDEFSLSHGGIRYESESLVPGEYWVQSQTSPAVWDLADAICDDGSEVHAISLEPGEVINCTFTYAKRGYILAKVITNPKADPQSFKIFPSYPELRDITLTDGARYDSQPLKPGNYELVVSQVPDNWELTKATCDNGSSMDFETSVLAIELKAGEIVYCTFRYSKGA